MAHFQEREGANHTLTSAKGPLSNARAVASVARSWQGSFDAHFPEFRTGSRGNCAVNEHLICVPNRGQFMSTSGYVR